MNADTKKSKKEPDYVVIETGKTSLRDLYTKEDWMAIWMGFFLLIVGMVIFLLNPPANMNENLAKYNSILKEEAAKEVFDKAKAPAFYYTDFEEPAKGSEIIRDSLEYPPGFTP